MHDDAVLWPAIPYPEWRGTNIALHLWSQVVGKYRLANVPWENHSWHATFYVVPRGLTTGTIHAGAAALILTFDLVEHRFVVETAAGGGAWFALESMSVAGFEKRVRDAFESIGQPFVIDGSPNEMTDIIPFAKDEVVRPYDAAAVSRFHVALLNIDRVFKRFRTGFLGKVSPVHLFWGSFDLAVTRFSGRRAPPHPGGVPNLPDAVTREAYSHEVSSAGFWPGEGVGEPMFYSYAYPPLDGFKDRAIEPAAARWDAGLGEFLLPYRAVCESADPDAALMRFLQTTYEAAADTAHWDRQTLECAFGVPGVPRNA
jgi:hypothetical protein